MEDIDTHKRKIAKDEKALFREEMRILKSKEKLLIKAGWRHYVPEGDWRDRDRGVEGWLKGYCRADSIDEAYDTEISNSY